jgi:hypothetical protein
MKIWRAGVLGSPKGVRSGAPVFVVPWAIRVVLGLGALLSGFAHALEGQGSQPPIIPVVGTVLDRTQGTPIPSARLLLTWAGAVEDERNRPSVTAVTDEEGRFRFPDVRVGSWRLEASALGYQTLSQTVTIDGAPPFTLGVRLAPGALAVEGIVVTTRRNPWLQENGFYARQARGLGVTYTGEEMEEIGIYQTTDLFRRLSGVTFRLDGSPTSPYVLFRGECGPDVVLDGLNMGPRVRIDDLVTPTEIEGIEVYRGPGAPGLFTTNPCGAVLIWTLGSAARDGRAWSYRRAAVAVGFLLIGFLLSR